MRYDVSTNGRFMSDAPTPQPAAPLTLTPVGTSPAWYHPGEPTSGFVLDTPGTRVLVDCGSGVIARYMQLFDPVPPVDAIVISHVHADHCFDLVPLKFAIEFGPLANWRPQLWLPPGAQQRLEHLLRTWDADWSFFESSFDVRHYDTGADGFDVGDMHLSALHVPHFIECCALRVDVPGVSFGFTADTGPDHELVPFMNGVDVLLSEAGSRAVTPGPRGHITAREAGELAHDAGVGSLLLTHISSDDERAAAVSQAAEVFTAGPVHAVRSGERHDIVARVTAAS